MGVNPQQRWNFQLQPCSVVLQEPGQKEFKGTLGSYIGDALSSVMGSNNPAHKGGKGADFDNTVFS